MRGLLSSEVAHLPTTNSACEQNKATQHNRNRKSRQRMRTFSSSRASSKLAARLPVSSQICAACSTAQCACVCACVWCDCVFVCFCVCASGAIVRACACKCVCVCVWCDCACVCVCMCVCARLVRLWVRVRVSVCASGAIVRACVCVFSSSVADLFARRSVPPKSALLHSTPLCSDGTVPTPPAPPHPALPHPASTCDTHPLQVPEAAEHPHTLPHVTPPRLTPTCPAL